MRDASCQLRIAAALALAGALLACGPSEEMPPPLDFRGAKPVVGVGGGSGTNGGVPPDGGAAFADAGGAGSDAATEPETGGLFEAGGIGDTGAVNDAFGGPDFDSGVGGFDF